MNFLFISNMGGGFLIFVLIYTIIWIYCVADVIRSDFKDSNMKLIWILILLFAQVVGLIAYLIMSKGTKTTTS